MCSLIETRLAVNDPVLVKRDMDLPFPPLPANGGKYFVWNSPEWWRWFTAFKRKPSADSIHRHLDEYDSFISFHGARPLDVATYYQKGLELGNIEALNQRAREVFLSKRCPEITSSILDAAIADASDFDDKKLFMVIDEREVSGHYLIYGSEHLCGLAAAMTREAGFDVRQILKYHGTPTLFRIALPRKIIPEKQIRELADYLLEIYWDARKRPRPPKIDWSFIMKQPIPPECMIDHVHPASIPDPLLQYYPYSYRDNFPCLA